MVLSQSYCTDLFYTISLKVIGVSCSFLCTDKYLRKEKNEPDLKLCMDVLKYNKIPREIARLSNLFGKSLM